MNLADEQVFLETIRSGSDSALWGCLRWFPYSKANWGAAIEPLSQRWGKGDWDYLYDAATWTSLAEGDYQNWTKQEREILLGLLVRSLRERKIPEATSAIYEVIDKAYDIKIVSGKTLNQMLFAHGPMTEASDIELANWLEVNKHQLLCVKPPVPKPSTDIKMTYLPGMKHPLDHNTTQELPPTFPSK
ncbi:MAG: hypothetical protein JXK07_15430 [Spirochaetes bacterium]|nr:hypothetical protein [Spirochaetota bacterium]